MRDVQPRAGKVGKLNITSHTNRFRGGGHPSQAQARGCHAFTHHCPRRQRNIFGVLHHRDVQRTAIGHDLTRKLGGSDRFSITADTPNPPLLPPCHFPNPPPSPPPPPLPHRPNP